MNSVERALISKVNRGVIPGAACAVYQGGETLFRLVLGYADKSHNKALRENSLFRAGALAKPVTAAAVLALCERDLLDLDAPINKYIKGFRVRGVGAQKGEKLVRSAPARPITLRDILTETSGLASGDIGKAQCSVLSGAADLASEIEALDNWYLDYEPGTVAAPSLYAYDLAARAVEVVTETPFADYVKERIFAPLGMEDATYLIDETNAGRLVKVHCYDEKAGKTKAIEDAPAKPFVGGADGLYTTLADYSQFVRMLAGKGEVDGKRALTAVSVNKLLAPSGHGEMFGVPGINTGLGVDVVLKKSKNQPLPKDSFRAVGGNGAYFRVEPKKGMCAVLFINMQEDATDIISEFESLLEEELSK